MSKELVVLLEEILKKYEDMEKRDPKTKLPGVLLDKAMDPQIGKIPEPPASAKPNLPVAKADDGKKAELAKNLKKCLTAKVEKAKKDDIDKFVERQKNKPQVKGVHESIMPNNPKYQGTSIAGSYHPGEKHGFGSNQQTSKEIHSRKLEELQNMPKPNLPKSQQEDIELKKKELAKNLKKALKI